MTQLDFVAHSSRVTQIPTVKREIRFSDPFSKERQLKNTQDTGGFVILMAVIGIILLMSTVVGASILGQR